MNTLRERLQNNRRFDFFSAACPADTFEVIRLSGFEAIGKPYRFELILVSDESDIDLAEVLAAGAKLQILAPDDASQATPYHGMLAEFDQLQQLGGFTFYRAVLVPRLWQLSLYRNSEVYLHEQSIPEIVEALLKSCDFRARGDYLFKLTDIYRPRSYVCQYQETPLDFISRWLEKEGIYYAFEQGETSERVVFMDNRLAQSSEQLRVQFRPADDLDTGLAPDSVQSLVCRTRMLPRRVVLQDFNHRRASLPLVAQADVSLTGLGDEMLYGENFRSPEEGERYARLRAQELLCGGRVFNGEATAVGMRTGRFMHLAGHYRRDFDGDYLVTEIAHEGSQAGALLAGLKTPYGEREGQIAYRNSFVALPSGVQFRSARSTPKPRVAGTMSATIDAEGSGEYAELDEYGQYKVQVPFDRTDKNAAKGSAPVRMATPYSGSDHGMHFPLHKGAEVLLSFADGDPDQPVIVGAVPNSMNRSVIDQHSAHDNLISTKGGNQMLMKDTEGKEVIWLNSPFHKSSIGIGSVDPRGDGSIFEATTGGSDKVSFGVNNSMSFGASNTLSVGSEASIKAAIGNSFSWGSSMAITATSGIKWNMDLSFLNKDVLAKGHNAPSFTIDDTSSIKVSEKFGGNSQKTAVIQAGLVATDLASVDYETGLKGFRAAIGVISAVNFGASAAYASFVNRDPEKRALEKKRDGLYPEELVEQKKLANVPNERDRRDFLARRGKKVMPLSETEEKRKAELQERKNNLALSVEEKTKLEALRRKKSGDLSEAEIKEKASLEDKEKGGEISADEKIRLKSLQDRSGQLSDQESAELTALEGKSAKLSEKETQELKALEEKEPLTKEEKNELDKNYGDLEARERRKKELDDEMNRNKKPLSTEEQERLDALSKPTGENMNFQGWPGVLGKFGLDALVNFASYGVMQGIGKSMAKKAAELKYISRFESGPDGILQSVNGWEAPAGNAATKTPDGGGKVRAMLGMGVDSGIAMEVTANPQLDPAPSESKKASLALYENLVRIAAYGGNVALKGKAVSISAAKDAVKDVAPVSSLILDQNGATLFGENNFLIMKKDILDLKGASINIGCQEADPVASSSKLAAAAKDVEKKIKALKKALSSDPKKEKDIDAAKKSLMDAVKVHADEAARWEALAPKLKGAADPSISLKKDSLKLVQGAGGIKIEEGKLELSLGGAGKLSFLKVGTASITAGTVLKLGD